MREVDALDVAVDEPHTERDGDTEVDEMADSVPSCDADGVAHADGVGDARDVALLDA